MLKYLINKGSATFLLIISILVLNSCTIQKRYHMPGYYIDWHNKKETKAGVKNIFQSEQEKESIIQSSITPYFSNEADTLEPMYASLETNYKLLNTNNSSSSGYLIESLPQQKIAKNDYIAVKLKILAPSKTKVFNVFALLSIITGTIGLVFFGILWGVAALLLGIYGLNLSIKNNQKWGDIRMPILGIVLGIMAIIVLFVLMSFLTLLLIVSLLSLIILVILPEFL